MKVPLAIEPKRGSRILQGHNLPTHIVNCIGYDSSMTCAYWVVAAVASDAEGHIRLHSCNRVKDLRQACHACCFGGPLGGFLTESLFAEIRSTESLGTSANNDKLQGFEAPPR
jgi:hypothetical protein